MVSDVSDFLMKSECLHIALHHSQCGRQDFSSYVLLFASYCISSCPERQTLFTHCLRESLTAQKLRTEVSNSWRFKVYFRKCLHNIWSSYLSCRRAQSDSEGDWPLLGWTRLHLRELGYEIAYEILLYADPWWQHDQGHTAESTRWLASSCSAYFLNLPTWTTTLPQLTGVLRKGELGFEPLKW